MIQRQIVSPAAGAVDNKGPMGGRETSAIRYSEELLFTMAAYGLPATRKWFPDYS
jgi:hypothetical protein